MFNRYIREDIKEKFNDLFQSCGISFVASIYLISIYYFISFFTDTFMLYSDEFLSVISILTFLFALFYSLRVLSNKKIKSFKHLADVPIKNFFHIFWRFLYCISFFKNFKIHNFQR